jgi:hypothetical protein
LSIISCPGYYISPPAIVATNALIS